MKLCVDKLTCVRGGRTLFSDLSFSLETGGGLLLHGRNGSGKTSLLRLICGFLQPFQGSITFQNDSGELDPGEYCHLVGHSDGVKGSFTVLENLKFWAGYLGGREVGDVLQMLDLQDLTDIPARYLSAGQKRRLALARLITAHRPLWLLDEPTVSLDKAARSLLVTIVEDHVRGGGLVIVATHVPLGLGFAQTLILGENGTAS